MTLALMRRAAAVCICGVLLASFFKIVDSISEVAQNDGGCLRLAESYTRWILCHLYEREESGPQAPGCLRGPEQV